MAIIKTKYGDLILDDEDYVRLQEKGYKSIHKNDYKGTAKFRFLLSDGIYQGVAQFVLNSTKFISYKDSNTLNNTKTNLLCCSTIKSHNLTGVTKTGVEKYRVCAKTKDGALTVGTYKNELMAAIAYNKYMDIFVGEGKYHRNAVNISDAEYTTIYANTVIKTTKSLKTQGMSRKSHDCTSNYVGVAANPNKSKPWVAKLSYQGVRIYLGIFETEVMAAQAYNEIATHLYGSDAILNVVAKAEKPLLNLESGRLKEKLDSIKGLATS